MMPAFPTTSDLSSLPGEHVSTAEPDLSPTLIDSATHWVTARARCSLRPQISWQAEKGAQVIQVFESWAHQLVPRQFEAFAKPYANLAMSKLKAKFPDVPVIYFANGGSSYLESQGDMQVTTRRLMGPCDQPLVTDTGDLIGRESVALRSNKGFETRYTYHGMAHEDEPQALCAERRREWRFNFQLVSQAFQTTTLQQAQR